MQVRRVEACRYFSEMSKYKEMYKKNGLKLGHPEEKFKKYLDSRRVRRSVLVDEQRDDAIFGCNEPEPTRYEPKSYKNMKIDGLNEIEKRSVTKSKVRPFVAGVVRHKIHYPPFLHGPSKQEPCAHSSKKNTTSLKSFAPRNYKFNPPKGLHIYTLTPAGSAGPASLITFDSIFRNRNQNNRNAKKSPENSPLRTITNTLAVQKDESEGVCIFGRLNLAKELNRAVSRMSSDTSPTLFNRTHILKSFSETVQSDEENNSIPQLEETTLQEINLINGIEQRPPILFKEDYKSYLSRVLATHVPPVTLSPGSSKVPNIETPALQVALSTDSPKTPNKRVQKKRNGSPALSPLLKLDTKGNSLKITPMKKAKGVRKNMD